LLVPHNREAWGLCRRAKDSTLSPVALKRDPIPRPPRLDLAAAGSQQVLHLDHPLLRAAQAVLGLRHDACRALAQAVRSDSPFDWKAAKERLSDLPDDEWEAIKDELRSSAVIPPAGQLH
jgi:hypothetical protein